MFPCLVDGTHNQYRRVALRYAVHDREALAEPFITQDIYLLHTPSAESDEARENRIYVFHFDRRQLLTQRLHPLAITPCRRMWDDAGNRLQLKIEGRRLAARRCGIIVLREMGTGKKVGAVIGIDCSSAHHAEPRLVVDLVTEDTPSWPEMPQGDDKTACSILHQYQHAAFINGEIASLHKRFFQRSQTFEFGLIHIIVDNSIGSEGEPRVFSVRLYVESPPHFMGQVLMDFLTCLLRELLRNNEALGWYFTMWLEMDSDNEQAFKVIAHGRAAPQEEISGSSLWELYVDKVHFGDKRPPLDFEVDRPSWTVAESLEILPIVAYWIESRRLFR